MLLLGEFSPALRGTLAVWLQALTVRLASPILGFGIKCFSSVIWTKSNPTPWNTIKPDEGTKLMSINQKFDKRYAPFPFAGAHSPLPPVQDADLGVCLFRYSWSRDKL